MHRKRKSPTLLQKIFFKKIEDEGVTITFEPGWTTTPPLLRVSGDLGKILPRGGTARSSDISGRSPLPLPEGSWSWL